MDNSIKFFAGNLTALHVTDINLTSWIPTLQHHMKLPKITRKYLGLQL